MGAPEPLGAPPPSAAPPAAPPHSPTPPHRGAPASDDDAKAINVQSEAEKDAIARMMAAQQMYVSNKASEAAAQQQDKEGKGFFKRLFGKKKDDEPEMIGKEISPVMSVEHTGHAGFDATEGLVRHAQPAAAAADAV
jgi:hypothetical protein